jgi:putative ABC transport system permease protein
MDALLQDFRDAVRALVKHPGFAALTVACLALGIGVNSTIFSVVDTVAIRPLPFKDPGRLVSTGSFKAGTGSGTDFDGLSYLDLQDWRARTRSFEQIAALSNRNFALSDGGEAERFDGALVSANLFPMLGIQPILGRQFRDEEDRLGAPDVVLIGYGVWQRRYGSDPRIAGRSVLVNGKPATIVGVMPVRFEFPERAQMWMPVAPATAGNRRSVRELGVYARLKPGVSIDDARKDVVGIAAQLAAEYPEDKDWTAGAKPLRDDFVPDDVRLIVFTMMGAATFVLLIACGNVANLLLARATVRQREIAVRAALGAGRSRIIRQLLTESVMVGLASTPLGVAIAYVGLRWLSASVPKNDIPYYIDWDMNTRVVVYTVAIAAITGIVFGLAPALQAARGDQHGGLKDGGRGTGGSVARNRLRSVLVSGEIALALVVLVGASLFVRTFINLEHARAGLSSEGLMTLRIFMVGDAYATPEARIRRVEDIVRRLEQLPGVQSAVASRMVPFNGGAGGSGVVPEGATFEPGKEPNSLYMGVTPHLLRTLGQPVVSGRDFTDADGASKSRVAIVNQVFAKRLWPNLTNAVGQRFKPTNDPQAEWITVIGTIGDFRLFTVRDGKPSPYAFVSYPYDPSRNTGFTIRVAGVPPGSIADAVRRQVRASDPMLAIFSEQTGDAARAFTYWQFRLFGWMFSIFGLVALALASVGVYGVLSYSVSQRTQEIGVRIALGASRQNVLRLVVGYGARLAAAGIAVGVVTASGVTRVVASQLYNVSPTDPLSFVATAAFLAIVALVASYVPARRATSVDPMIALRAE